MGTKCDHNWKWFIKPRAEDALPFMPTYTKKPASHTRHWHLTTKCRHAESFRLIRCLRTDCTIYISGYGYGFIAYMLSDVCVCVCDHEPLRTPSELKQIDRKTPMLCLPYNTVGPLNVSMCIIIKCVLTIVFINIAFHTWTCVARMCNECETARQYVAAQRATGLEPALTQQAHSITLRVQLGAFSRLSTHKLWHDTRCSSIVYTHIQTSIYCGPRQAWPAASRCI